MGTRRRSWQWAVVVLLAATAGVALLALQTTTSEAAAVFKRGVPDSNWGDNSWTPDDGDSGDSNEGEDDEDGSNWVAGSDDVDWDGDDDGDADDGDDEDADCIEGDENNADFVIDDEPIGPVNRPDEERFAKNWCPLQDDCKYRWYYIAADEEVWDYSPTGMNNYANAPLEDVPTSASFTVQGPGRIGHKYLKAIYYGYTDDTFTERLPKPAHFGLVGPVVRAEINEVIVIVFKNNGRFNYSVHPHGVLYDKDSEGATEGVAEGGGARVAPGDTYTYFWPVPERTGPAEDFENAVLWGYHSHVSEADLFDGLMGPLVVYRQGILDDDNEPRLSSDIYPIDEEFFTLWIVIDENASNYLRLNLERFAENTTVLPEEWLDDPLVGANIRQGIKGPGARTEHPVQINVQDPDFMNSNQMHVINGYFFANLPGLDLVTGTNVRWFMWSFGSGFDIHTAHWHGLTATDHFHRLDVIELFVATFRIADMYVDNIGKWLMHCHVSRHFHDGMVAYMYVTGDQLYEALASVRGAAYAAMTPSPWLVLTATGLAAWAAVRWLGPHP